MKSSRRMNWVCLSLVGVAAFMYALTPYFALYANLTRSLPGQLYLVVKNAEISKGHLVAFKWHGGAHYPEGVTFIKIVNGVPGDQVNVREREVYVNDERVGVAELTSKRGDSLAVTRPGEIPVGEIFVATSSPQSLDSRYALVGLIKKNEVIGRAYEIF